MAETKAEIRERIRELEHMAVALKSHIRAIRSTMENDTFYHNSLEQKRKTILVLEQEIDMLVQMRTNGYDMIEGAKKRIRSIKTKIAKLKAKEKVVDLVNLQREIEFLKKTLPRSVIEETDA